MQISHASSDIRGKGESKSPVKGNVIVLKDIIETSLGTVLGNDVDIAWVLDGGTNKLAKIGVVNHPALKGSIRAVNRGIGEHTNEPSSPSIIL